MIQSIFHEIMRNRAFQYYSEPWIKKQKFFFKCVFLNKNVCVIIIEKFICFANLIARQSNGKPCCGDNSLYSLAFGD